MYNYSERILRQRGKFTQKACLLGGPELTSPYLARDKWAGDATLFCILMVGVVP